VANFYTHEPSEQRRQGLRRLFRYLRAYVGPYHPYLRRLYREAGIDLARLRTEDDLRRLPIIDKSHLQANPLAFILQPKSDGTALPAGFDTAPPTKLMLARYAWQAITNRPRDYALACRPTDLRGRIRRRALGEWMPVHFHASSGTTDKPTPAAYTHNELTRVLPELAGLLMLRPRESRPDELVYDWTDRAMNLFPGAPHLAFFSSIWTKAAIGTSSFETGGGHVIPTDRQVALFAEGRFASLLSVPSYPVHWLRRAAVLLAEGRIGPLSSLKFIVMGAEPSSPSLRRCLRELALAVGADPRLRIHETLGMTEMKWWFAECAEGSGIHLNPKFYFWELLHPETREPVAEDQPGVLVFSHIGWRGTVLTRYWTGDLVQGGLRWARCPHCGYTFPSVFGPICRAVKDFTKLKGTRVDLSLLVETVRATPGVRNFQVSLESEDGGSEYSRDMLAIHVLPEADQSPAEIQRRLVDRVKHATEVGPDRVLFETDERAFVERLFARTGIKAEYVVERRRNHI
jgi:phenylacetate-CoA ligase